MRYHRSNLNKICRQRTNNMFKLLRWYLIVRDFPVASRAHPTLTLNIRIFTRIHLHYRMVLLLLTRRRHNTGYWDGGGSGVGNGSGLDSRHLGSGSGGRSAGSLWLIMRLTREAIMTGFVFFSGISTIPTRIC